MFAIIKASGKQYKVQKGEEIYVELMDAKPDEMVTFNEVLMIDSKVGNPTIKGASVVCKVVKHGKQPKITIVKHKKKHRYKKMTGHRQPYTKLIVESING